MGRRVTRKPKPAKVGRPPSANPRKIKRPVLLTADEAEAHDAARGEQPWSEWIREAAELAIARGPTR